MTDVGSVVAPLVPASPSVDPSAHGAVQANDRTVMMREKAEALRREKLELVDQQVKNWTLVIRKMTEEERALYPPRNGQRKRGRPLPRVPLN